MAALVLVLPPRQSLASEMVLIEKGTLLPFFDRSKDGKKQQEQIASFYIDKYPVTNADFLEFVKSNPTNRKSQIKRIFADANYLSHWQDDLVFDQQIKNQPIRFVSWFAANRYCDSKNKELPTVAQWEYVAAADATDKNASQKDEFKSKILNWYSKPSNNSYPDVKNTFKNAWGVYGMHGLVWEWTSDFNISLVTGESREDSTINKDRFCGSGVLGAKDSRDYAAFMRYGFRSSLKGQYTVSNLGFRCARNISLGDKK